MRVIPRARRAVLCLVTGFVLAWPVAQYADTPRTHTDSPATVAYTDDPLVAGNTPFRLVQLTELRNAVNAIRQAAGLSAFSWTDPSPANIRAIHIKDLRTAIAPALTALGRPVPAWTDPLLDGKQLRAVYLQEIRTATRWGPSNVAGQINTNTTWVLADSPYVITSDITVGNGATLTIPAGTIIKFAPGANLYISPGARLQAAGTTAQPIYFTSLEDDAIGGDTNGDGSVTFPRPGDWGTVSFNGASGQPALGILSHVVIRYGGSLFVLYSAPLLQDFSSTFMSGHGLFLDSPPASQYVVQRLTLTDNQRNLKLSNVPSTTTIFNCVIRRAVNIAIDAQNGTAAQIRDNSIDDNQGNAAIVADSTSPITLHYNSITNNRSSDGIARGIDAACCVNVDATWNWWGSVLGPQLIGQPETGGARITGNVQYDNWLGSPWAGSFRNGAGHQPWTLKAGVSTDVGSGNFYLAERDISITTIGFPLEVSRTYNNKSSGGKASDLGVGWTWSYGVQLETGVDTYGVIWDRADGGQSYFKRNPDDTFSPEEGIYERLTLDRATNTYRMVRKDQSILVFAGDGTLSSQIDANGNTTVITRDGNHRVTQVTEPLNRRSLTFQYSGSYVSRITDPLGRTVDYTHNGNGFITAVTKRDQFGTIYAVSNYTYGAGVWEMTEYDDADGNRLVQTFDYPNQRVITQRFNELATIFFSYDNPVSGATSVVDTHGRLHVYYYYQNNRVFSHDREQPNGSLLNEDTWQYIGYLTSSYASPDGQMYSVYDWGTGNLNQVNEPGGRITFYSYDAYNNLTKKQDNLGRETIYTYDGHQNLVREKDALGNVTEHVYFPNGLKQVDVDPLSHTTSYSYDANGYPLAVVNGLGETTSFEYDAAGRKTAETDALHNRTVYTYNGRDQIITMTDPLPLQTSFSYDFYGRKTSATDQSGHTTTYSYNQHNQLSTITDPRGGTVALTYDDFTGNLLQVADPDFHITRYTYDDLDRKASETDGLNRTWYFTYIGRNRLSTVTDARGLTTHYAYNTSNDLAQITFADNSYVLYSYDGVGNRTAMSDWTGTTNWQYDALNRAINVNTNGQSTGYGYDLAGNLSYLFAENGRTVYYGYDAANRMKTVTDWGGRVTTYSYDAAGRLTACAYPNQVTGTRLYDNSGRTLRVAYSNGNGIIASANYGLDPNGNRTSKADKYGATESYSYDELNRLIFASYPDGRGVSYGYDPAGNRTAKTPYLNGFQQAPTTYYNYDSANQAYNSDFGSRSYDENGALVYDGGRGYGWNLQRLLASAYANGVSAYFAYDGDGRRIQRTQNGVTTSYVVNTLPKISQVLKETTNGTTTYYVYGHDLLYTVVGSTPHYIHQDALGSTISVTDGTGFEESHFSWDVFGLLSAGSSWYYFPPHGFAGEERDDTTLIYLRARYYDPWFGQFLSRDRSGPDLGNTQSINPYTYAENDPATLTDPSGNYAVLDDALLFGIGAVGGVIGQGINDLMSGKWSPPSHYLASAIGGGVSLALAEYVGPFAGAAGGFVSGAITQAFDIHAKRQSGWNLVDLGADTLIGALSPGDFRVPGISAGRNSDIAIARQMITKIRRDRISRVSSATALRMLRGYTVRDFPQTIFQSAATSAWYYFRVPTPAR